MAVSVLVCAGAEVAEGGRVVVDIPPQRANDGRVGDPGGERTIGIFRVKNKLYAYENTCPHQGGPVCQGAILPRVLERLSGGQEFRAFEFSPDELHIVCPWHGFEFNLESGCHPGKPEIRLRALEVREEEGEIYVDI